MQEGSEVTISPPIACLAHTLVNDTGSHRLGNLLSFCANALGPY